MKKIWLSLIFLSACRGGYKAPDVTMASEFITQAAKFDEKHFNPKFWENLNDP